MPASLNLRGVVNLIRWWLLCFEKSFVEKTERELLRLYLLLSIYFEHSTAVEYKLVTCFALPFERYL
jgi:hypothetical protein